MPRRKRKEKTEHQSGPTGILGTYFCPIKLLEVTMQYVTVVWKNVHPESYAEGLCHSFVRCLLLVLTTVV